MDSSKRIKRLYDAACKEVLSEQGIAAHIMKTCVEEFKDIPVKEITPSIIPSTALPATT